MSTTYMDERLKCPVCGEVLSLHDICVGGATEGHGFCPMLGCHTEFNLEATEAVGGE